MACRTLRRGLRDLLRTASVVGGCVGTGRLQRRGRLVACHENRIYVRFRPVRTADAIAFSIAPRSDARCPGASVCARGNTSEK